LVIGSLAHWLLIDWLKVTRAKKKRPAGCPDGLDDLQLVTR